MTLSRRLLARIAGLDRTWGLVAPGERILVACSGGKDSWALLHLLRAWSRRLPFPIALVAVHVDQGHPGHDPTPLVEHLVAHGFDHRIVVENTHDRVVAATPPGKTFCSRCSRMRRGVLHRVAAELGATAIALGHHREDLIETLLLNQLYAGRTRALAARLAPQDGGAALIRPLLSCGEADLAAYATECRVPILPCNLCGSQPDTRRQAVKAWIAQLERDNPRVRQTLLAAAGNVEVDRMLDRRLTGGATPTDGDDDDDASPPIALRVVR